LVLVRANDTNFMEFGTLHLPLVEEQTNWVYAKSFVIFVVWEL